MATQRINKSSSEEEKKDANGTAKSSAIQSRQSRKDKLQKEKEFHEKLRWVIFGVVLILAAIGLYFYFTHYYQLPPDMPIKDGVTKGNKDGVTKGNKDGVTKGNKDGVTKGNKNSKQQQTTKQKRGEKREGEKRKKGGQMDKAADHRRQEKAEGKKKSKSDKKDAAKKERKKAAAASDSLETINKLKTRVLRQPIPGGDPDRPHMLDILTADNLLVDNKFEEALERFNAILSQFPQSPRAQFGKGITLSYMADIRKSNKLMDSAISFFKSAGLESIIASEVIKVPALVAMADKAQARGKLRLAMQGMEKLVELRPQSIVYANQLGMLYIGEGDKRKAKGAFRKALKKFDVNPFASAQLGYLLYVDKKYEEALPLLMDGLRHDAEIREEGRFYNYAGDTLTKLNRSDEALALYGEGVGVGVFPSIWQRSLVNEPDLRMLPWWPVDVTGYMTDIVRLEKQMEVIASEALANFDTDKMIFRKAGKTNGDPHFVLFSKGKKNLENCLRAPKTCALLETFPEAAGCKRGTIKFSSLPPHTHVGPHVSNTNTKLQIVLGLQLDPKGGIRIRVAQDVKVIGHHQIGVLDESFEKEVWYVGMNPGVYMSVDIWHPDLAEEKWRLLGPL